MVGNYLRPRRLWAVLGILGLAAWVMILCPQPASAAPAVHQLPGTTVSTTRSDQEIAKLARNVTVITADQIAAMNAASLVEVLRNVPGISFINYTGTMTQARVDMRGFGEGSATRVLVTVDGRRVNTNDLSGADFSTIPVENIERIEVLHGPAGVVYGDNAVGGVINIITKEGQGKPQAKLRAYYGMYSTYGINGHAQGGFDKFSFFLSAGHQSSDGYRERSASDISNFTFSTRYYFSDAVSLLFDGGYTATDYQMPGALTLEEMNQDRRQSVNPADWADSRDGYVRAQFRGDWNTAGIFTIDVSYRFRDGTSEWAAYDSRRQTDIGTIGLQPKWVWERGLGTVVNRLTVGIDYYYSTSTLESYTLAGPLTEATDFTWSTLGIYLFDEITFAKRLTLSFGVRWQKGDFDIENTPSGSAAASHSYDENQYAWTVGLAYRLAPQSKVYARVSRTFRFPVADEYFTFGGFMALEPEQAMNYEAGVEYTFMQNGRASLTFFWMEVTDEISYNSITMLNENLDDTRHVGVEASLRVPFGAGSPSYGFATFTWQKVEFTAGPNEGNLVPLVPEIKASAGVSLQPFEGFTATGQINYVGKRYMGQDFGNVADQMDSYFTVDLRLSYRWKQLEVFLNALNILGQEYESASFYSEWGSGYYPAPTRQIWGGLSFRF